MLHGFLAAFAALTASPLMASSGRFDGIPAADDRMPAAQTLQLELVVNGVPSGVIVPVTLGQGRCEMAASDLVAAGVMLPAGLSGTIEIAALDGVAVDYDQSNQRLRLDVPSTWLPHQSVGGGGTARVRPQSSFGVVLNYDLNFVDTADRAPRAVAWGEARMFGDFGQVSLTGAVQGGHVIRYDLNWSHSDDERMITYEAGDFVTRSLPGNRPVRMAGIQISRDFSVRPDVITYPLPEFAGDARLPSAVDLLIDGYRAAGGQVAPGAFAIGAMPGLNGAGQATLAVTDMLGRRVTTTIPFYVSNDLLRPGLLDFSGSAGVLRRNYGRRNFDYGLAAATAALRYGVSRLITVEGSAEAGSGFASASLGALVQLGNAGVVNAGYAVSDDHGETGDRLTLGYQYRARRFGFAASHVRESDGFSDLSSIGDRHAARTTTIVATSLSSDALGNFGASYVETSDRRGQDLGLASGSWSMSLARGVTLFTSGTYEVRRRQWSGALNLILPLGGSRGTAATSVAREARGATTLRADYGRAIPASGGLGGNAMLARASDTGLYGSGELAWRSAAMEVRGGAYGRRGNITRWAGVSGSVVAIGNDVLLANRIADSFVLVNTGGRAGVPVRYENQLVGRSGGDGHVLVPWVPAYYAGRYSIDPFDLPTNVAVPVVEKSVAVARGSGLVLNFDLREMRSGRVTLIDAQGVPLPVGAIASINAGPALAIGWDGFLFVETLEDINAAIVTLPDGGRCTAEFAAPPPGAEDAMIGPVACR
ncbi:fimbria/pilus outer membrane usher protein [Sphingomonas colocasiae]|uniref:Fimbria/pilus outer membrane usher protein n=1 Tax=Sphingomonas colocasiae TaxID=1848973 RepID=A0ABS7PKL7_9SPHN|nr:fimbria/pilus outer membrane usher protein [Sphingomonas colocasiae]MBY8821791.1 fimbria/pilus outer membrane usher protein [Sphingomonas colocasiae]